MLSITAIGSCRVANPLRAGATTHGLKVNTSRIFGYTHSSSEALQQVRYLKGVFTPIDVVRPLLMPKIAPDQHRNLVHHPSLLYVIEISSAKRAMVADNHVQWNHIARHFSSFLAAPDRARSFWALASGKSERDKRAFLSRQREYRKLNETDKWLLRNMTLQHCGAARLHADIRAMLAILPNCLFVTHCNARMPDGNRIPTRAAFISVLRWVLEDLGANYFDPTDEMEKFGQHQALKDERGSLSHYSPRFEAHLLHIWNERYFKPLAHRQRDLQPWLNKPPMAEAG